MSDDLAVDAVRALLFGRRGPYADIREAVDELDNLAVLVDGLDPEGRATLARTLLTLAADDDPIVATRAAIGIGSVAAELDLATAVAAVRSDDPRLDRAAVGPRTSLPTVRAELVIRIVRAATDADAVLVEPLVAAPPAGVERAELLRIVAPSAPALVLAHAWRWCGPDDVAVLVRLPTHWHRVSFAGALAPWSAATHDDVDRAARLQGWVEADTAALHRAMDGSDPTLVRPAELDAAGRWWVIAGVPWDWAVWRSDLGTHALEVLRAGWSQTSTSRLLEPTEVDAFVAEGVDALAAAIEELRNR